MKSISYLRRILSREEKVRLRGVLILAIGTAILEMLSVYSVIPFVAILSAPETYFQHPAAQWAVAVLGLDSPRDLLAVTAGSLLLLSVASHLAATLSLRQIYLLAWNIHHGLSYRLLSIYLSRPYSWFLDRNSGELNRKVHQEIPAVIHGSLIHLMQAGVRTVGAAFVMGLLIFVDFRLTLVVGGLLAACYLIINVLLRRLIDRLGKMRLEASEIRFRVFNEALAGIKEVKSLGIEEELLRRFDQTGKPMVRSVAWGHVAAESPRHALEVLSVGAVLAALFYLIAAERSLEATLPILTLFAFAGYKLVPAFHQVFTAINQSRFHLAALRGIQDDLTAELPVEISTEEHAEPLQLNRQIELINVSFRYAGATSEALDGVSLQIKRGERVGIVGPTGSGKTTLGDLLLGLLRPQTGQFLIDGVPLGQESWTRWRAAVGYVPQSVVLTDDSLEANIAFGRPAHEIDREKVAEAAAKAALDTFVRELPDGWATAVGEGGVRLSGGERQRIAIARALYRDPSVLLLDEATSSLDPVTERSVMNSVFELGPNCTVIMVAHRLDILRRCDRILVMEGARVAAKGTWDELIEESDLFRVLARHKEPRKNSAESWAGDQ